MKDDDMEPAGSIESLSSFSPATHSRMGYHMSSISYLDQSRYTGKFNINKFIHTRLVQRGLAVHSHDLLGHYGCVNTIAFSNGDQNLLASGSDDQRVLIWRMLDNPGKKPIKELRGHLSNIFHAVFNHDNTHIISCANDHSIKYYDIEASSQPIASMDTHQSAVYRLSISPQSDSLFLSASEDHSQVFVWDLRDYSPSKLVCSKGAFSSVQWAPQGNYFVTANTKCGVQLWDMRASLLRKLSNTPAEPLIQYSSRFRHVSGARFNSDGSQIIASVRKDGPTLFNILDSTPVHVFTDPQYQNSCTMKGCTFVGNYDEFVASGSDDFRVYLWKIPNKATSGPTSNKSTVDDSKDNNDKNINNNNNNSTDNNNNNATNTNHNNKTNNYAFLDKSNGNQSQTKTKTKTPYKYDYNHFCEDESEDRHQPTAYSVLLGHRSIVNNVVWNNNLGILCSAGVEKIVKVWSTFSMNEEDDRPRVYQPRARQPLTHLYGEDTEETVEESKNTLGLFDFFLEMDEAGARIGDTDSSSSSSSSSDEDDEEEGNVPVMRRVLAYGEEGRPSVEVVYSFEVQDSASESDDENDDEDEEEENGFDEDCIIEYRDVEMEGDDEDDEDDDEEDDMEVYDERKDGRKWRRGEYTFEVQDSESSEDEVARTEGGGSEEGSTSTVGMMMSWRPSDDEESETNRPKRIQKGKTKEKTKEKASERGKEKSKEKAKGKEAEPDNKKQTKKRKK